MGHCEKLYTQFMPHFHHRIHSTIFFIPVILDQTTLIFFSQKLLMLTVTRLDNGQQFTAEEDQSSLIENYRKIIALNNMYTCVFVLLCIGNWSLLFIFCISALFEKIILYSCTMHSLAISFETFVYSNFCYFIIRRRFLCHNIAKNAK